MTTKSELQAELEQLGDSPTVAAAVQAAIAAAPDDEPAAEAPAEQEQPAG